MACFGGGTELKTIQKRTNKSTVPTNNEYSEYYFVYI